MLTWILLILSYTMCLNLHGIMVCPMVDWCKELFLQDSQRGCAACLGVLIDAWDIADTLGTIGIAQSAQGLLKVCLCRANVGNHHSLGVAAQGILEQPCQLAIPVWYVACASKLIAHPCSQRTHQCKEIAAIIVN